MVLVFCLLVLRLLKSIGDCFSGLSRLRKTTATPTPTQIVLPGQQLVHQPGLKQPDAWVLAYAPDRDGHQAPCVIQCDDTTIRLNPFTGTYLVTRGSSAAKLSIQ